MALFWVPGRGLVDDQEEGASIPEYGELTLPNGEKITWGDKGVERLPEYTLPAQFGEARFQWRPGAHTQEWLPGLSSYAVNYIPSLMEMGEAQRAGTLKDYEREQYEQMRQQAMAIPHRDWTQLQAGYPGEGGDWSQYLTPSSPDAGAIMLQLDERIRSGQATGQERQLFDTFLAQMRHQNYVASVPQASDAFSPISNEFMLALGALGGAVGGAGAFGAFAPVAGAGGAAAGAAAPSLLGIPTSTLGTIGAIGSYGGTGAGLLGAVTGQPWLSKLGLGLGVVGGLAGGLAGLGNVFSGGIQNVGDVARLAGSAGRITGALGRASGVEPLQQAGRYLGLGSQLGSLGSGVAGLLGAAQGVQAGATGGPMAWDDFGDQDWLNWSGGGQGMLLSDAGSGLDWGSFTAGGPGSWYGQELTDWGGSGGGSWLGSLGGLASGALGALGRKPGLLGAGVSALGSLGSGLLGANAAGNASAAQAAALQRGLDLQTAQWLQTQANQAPWLQAGREALGHMTGRMAWNGPQQPGATPAVSGANYALPGTTPGWQPSTYAGYTPTDVPSAAPYAYRPGQVPGAAQYRYTPGALPTLSGKELLANDPGVQFRLDRARNALEGSAAARGSLLSGPTLAALQEQGQDLASQEYANAWQRAAQQAQMREGWAQTASQLGFGQAMDETRLREQLAQVAGAQNWQQALQEAQARAQQQQFGWQAGFQGQQQTQREREAYDTALYNRLLQQSQIGYGRDVYQNEQDYQRQQQAYAQQIAELTRQWNQFASVAGLGQLAGSQLGQLGAGYAGQMGNLYGQLGTAQALGPLGQAQGFQTALGGLTNNATAYLRGLNA
jgi:hypothetical protein